MSRSNIDASDGAVEELDRIVSQIRAAWPTTHILVRGDSAFCREPLMLWCEDQDNVDFAFGLAKNQRLIRRIAKETRERCKRTGGPARVFADFRYQTRSSCISSQIAPAQR